MASLTKLNRRLLRWQRYADAIDVNVDNKLTDGYWRAFYALAAERVRRSRVRNVYWPADDEPRCTLTTTGGDYCYCTGRLGCQSGPGINDLCEYCEDPACFGDCWGEEPGVVTEHAFIAAGLL